MSGSHFACTYWGLVLDVRLWALHAEVMVVGELVQFFVVQFFLVLVGLFSDELLVGTYEQLASSLSPTWNRLLPL